MNPIVECIPNFSEGRRIEVVDAIEKRPLQCRWYLDSRSAYGPRPQSIGDHAGRDTRTAWLNPSLRECVSPPSGSTFDSTREKHPRTGATDVIPLVPLRKHLDGGLRPACVGQWVRVLPKSWRSLSISTVQRRGRLTARTWKQIRKNRI